VVAAIRGVTTGAALAQIKKYAATPVKLEQQHLSQILAGLTEKYAAAVEKVTAAADTEYIDFHARRLVEMAGHIIMGYLLLLDSQRDGSYSRSAEVFIKRAKAWNAERASYIADSRKEDLAAYRAAIEEKLEE
jgi:hypothetical protein